MTDHDEIDEMLDGITSNILTDLDNLYEELIIVADDQAKLKLQDFYLDRAGSIKVAIDMIKQQTYWTKPE